MPQVDRPKSKHVGPMVTWGKPPHPIGLAFVEPEAKRRDVSDVLIQLGCYKSTRLEEVVGDGRGSCAGRKSVKEKPLILILIFLLLP